MKILRAAGCFTLSIFIVISTIFTNFSGLEAAEMNSDGVDDNSMGIVIKESSNSMDNSKANTVPDLGDDQAFPFIPGFGKNSGKD